VLFRGKSRFDFGESVPIAVPLSPLHIELVKCLFEPRGQLGLSFGRFRIAGHDLLLKFRDAIAIGVAMLPLGLEFLQRRFEMAGKFFFPDGKRRGLLGDLHLAGFDGVPFVAKLGVLAVELLHPPRQSFSIIVESRFRVGQLRLEQLELPPHGLDLLPVRFDIGLLGLHPGKARFDAGFFRFDFRVLRFDFHLFQREPRTFGGDFALITFDLSPCFRELRLSRVELLPLFGKQLPLTLQFLAGRGQFAVGFLEDLAVGLQLLPVDSKLRLAHLEVLPGRVEFFGFQFEELAIFLELLLARIQFRFQIGNLLTIFLQLRRVQTLLLLFLGELLSSRFQVLLVSFEFFKLRREMFLA